MDRLLRRADSSSMDVYLLTNLQHRHDVVWILNGRNSS